MGSNASGSLLEGVAVHKRDKRSSVADLGLPIDVVQVNFHRAFGESQSARDFLVC
jgi:hypothetical protein